MGSELRPGRSSECPRACHQIPKTRIIFPNRLVVGAGSPHPAPAIPDLPMVGWVWGDRSGRGWVFQPRRRRN